MISLELALVFFLVLACSIFSVVYSYVDTPSEEKTGADIFRNIRMYVLGLFACGVLVNILQGVFGQ